MRLGTLLSIIAPPTSSIIREGLNNENGSEFRGVLIEFPERNIFARRKKGQTNLFLPLLLKFTFI